ncbi:Uncharacterised protein [Bordetella ansorpii]|uniref:Uncharacterized protein n=1 Tax=Bordetella ansorpii TaxID=288768 RepID=A0A157QZT4_9BORD|nr:Uncharacterised protein [Bordetella ansorpii]
MMFAVIGMARTLPLGGMAVGALARQPEGDQA